MLIGALIITAPTETKVDPRIKIRAPNLGVSASGVHSLLNKNSPIG